MFGKAKVARFPLVIFFGNNPFFFNRGSTESKQATETYNREYNRDYDNNDSSFGCMIMYFILAYRSTTSINFCLNIGDILEGVLFLAFIVAFVYLIHGYYSDNSFHPISSSCSIRNQLFGSGRMGLPGRGPPWLSPLYYFPFVYYYL